MIYVTKHTTHAGLILFLLILLNLPVAGHEALFQEDLRFHHLTSREGLTQGTIETIIQDHQGYMWFGSHDGLNKYNSQNITAYKYDPDDSSSISYNQISDLLEDSNNNLWIGTSGRGFNLYNRETDNFTRYGVVDDEEFDVGLTENTAVSLAEDHNGYIWVGTENGLNRFDPETEEFVHFIADPDDPGSITSNRITRIVVDSEKQMWVGTRNGLNRKDPGTEEFKNFKHDPGDPATIGSNHISSIYEDREGTIWIGTRGGGLNKFDRESETFTKFLHDESNPNSISDNAVSTILEDSRGVLWIGGENMGLNAFDRENNRFYRYTHDPKNPSTINFDAIHDIYESDTQILWIGSYSGGLSYIDLKPPRFEFYKQEPLRENSLSNNNILTFWEEPDGDFWVGTDGGGLNRFNRETRFFFPMRHDPSNPNSIPTDVILDIKTGPEGDLWVGTYMGGLTRIDLDNKTFTHHRNDPDNSNTLNFDDVYRLHFTDDELWIGTHGGGLNVMDLESGDFRHYRRNDQDTDILRNDYIQAIYEDREGTMWIGTHGGGLARYHEHNGTFTTYARFNNTLSSIVVSAIHEDSRGQLWVGTNHGLNLFDRDNETYEVFTTEHGLASNFVNGILEDDEGNLWMSTNNGISKFYPDTGDFENYRMESGLQGNEFNIRSFFRDSEGYMYFGGVYGFNRFHPNNIAPSEYVAPVVFTNFLIFNQPVPIGGDSPLQKHISQTDHITLSHDQSVLTFEFVTLNFEIRKYDTFAYMLEGFDQSWNLVGDKRSATYTNLSPGEYRLRVVAANSDMVLGTEEATVGLTITPPFWRTTWFFLLAGFSTIGFFFGIYRRRVYTISEQNRLLEQEVNARTSELHDRNATLKETLDKLQETRNELVEKAHKAGMADVATSVLHDVGNILNSVNVSTAVISETINHSRLQKLHKANELLRQNLGTLDDFILNNPKGKTLMEYYVKLDSTIAKEYATLKEQNNRLSKKIDLIIDVITAQQNYSMAGRITEEHSIEDIIEDTLKITANNILHNQISVRKNYKPVNPVPVQKTKLVHVLVNLLKNAVESIDLQKPEIREVTISIDDDEKMVYVSISDTGTGFDKSLKSKIFTHGFTNKPNGHGYGLHSCANYMNEMDGGIKAESDGPGKGAKFTIHLPRIPASQQNPVQKS